VTREELHMLWDGMTDEMRLEAERIFQEKRAQLFKWHGQEEEKVDGILKADERYRAGLDAHNVQPETVKLSEEYQRRLTALMEESICVVAGQQV